MSALLDLRNLQVRFRTPTGEAQAVNGVSLRVGVGETLGLVGESGSGKSVSMLSLLRLIPTPPGRIVGGEAWFEGRDLLTLNDRDLRSVRGNRLAMIFQDPLTALNPVLTIERQLTEGMERHLGLSYRAARDRALELLTIVGIPAPADRLKAYPHQFSGGMRQRVAIALALALSLIHISEPTRPY